MEYFEKMDCHKWIIALEHGKGGLKHWQLRFKIRGCDNKEGKTNFFNAWKAKFPEAHIEFTENWCDYERKEGTFVTSDDTREVLGIRFGKPNRWQNYVMDTIRSAGDREIDCFYDPRGNHGKSWLSIYMYERGKALLVPRYATSARGLSQFVCSAYNGQGVIIIDIPRSGKVTSDLYEAIEELKDGIVCDERYSGKTRNIRGCKICIFTNTKLDTECLSKDRWRLHGVNYDHATITKRKKRVVSVRNTNDTTPLGVVECNTASQEA